MQTYSHVILRQHNKRTASENNTSNILLLGRMGWGLGWAVLGWAYRGLTGGFLLLQNFCVAISVSPHVCFILVLILISMFLR